MISYPYIEALFRSVLQRSTAIEGRFFICPKGGNEINSDSLSQMMTDALTQLPQKKYPCMLMMPPRSVGEFTDTQVEWEKYRITTFWLRTSYHDHGQGANINPNTQTSLRAIQEDWTAMKACAKDFLRVLEKIQRRHMLQKDTFRLVRSSRPFVPVSLVGVDNASGVRMDFEVELMAGCDIEDYADDSLILPPGFEVDEDDPDESGTPPLNWSVPPYGLNTNTGLVEFSFPAQFNIDPNDATTEVIIGDASAVTLAAGVMNFSAPLTEDTVIQFRRVNSGGLSAWTTFTAFRVRTVEMILAYDYNNPANPQGQGDPEVEVQFPMWVCREVLLDPTGTSEAYEHISIANDAQEFMDIWNADVYHQSRGQIQSFRYEINDNNANPNFWVYTFINQPFVALPNLFRGDIIDSITEPG